MPRKPKRGSSNSNSSSTAPFPFPDLPQELALCIVGLLARSGYKALGPLIASGKVGKTVALSDEVLRDMTLKEFLYQPALANPTSDERSFFVRCFEAKNPDACYLEGIRIVCQDGRPSEGITLLKRSACQTVHQLFAIGIFHICLGSKKRGLKYITGFEEMVRPFRKRDMYGDQLLEFVAHLRTRTEYGLYHHWRNALGRPDQCINCNDHSRCPRCYVYWISCQIINWC